MPPIRPTRSAVGVQVYLIPSTPAPSLEAVAWLATLLPDDERTRASRFARPADRGRFVVARAATRSVLGTILDRPPHKLRFAYGASGKPALADSTVSAIGFNLAHSDALTLLAVTDGCEVGIDLEPCDPLVDWRALAQTFFSRSECRALDELEATQQRRAFFQCWTRKEAVLKAAGVGLSCGLDRFDVTVGATRLPRVLSPDPAWPTVTWTLLDLDVPAPLVASVATMGPCETVEYHSARWPSHPDGPFGEMAEM
jgi:4'-phosphopantetheinyl transferase